MTLIALDLELEQPKTNHQTPDSLLDTERIIQVGYVVFQVEPTFKVLKEYSSHVNIGVPLSKFIKDLTGITDEQVFNGTDLLNIYQDLLKDIKEYKCSRAIRQWGGGDMDAFRRELDLYHPGTKWELGRSGFNVKHLYQAFMQANGRKWQGGLSKSMSRVGLQWQGRGKHDAKIDALNTAVMYNFLYNKLKEDRS